VGLFAARGSVGQIAGGQGFAKSVVVDHGTYFRLKVKFTYKGEPQDFDIVVGCNVRQTNYRDNSRTVEIGMVPQVFGRRMTDGKAVVVRPPEACHGETTANGKVQADLLPLIVVYDDADTLAFGTAYLSEDAYDSPLSVLSFKGASIDSATRAEFDEFRRTQQNVVTSKIYQRKLKQANLPGARDIPLWGDWCVGYVRYRLPEEIRGMVRPHWPAERPRYWLMADVGARVRIEGTLSLSKAVQSDSADSSARPWRAFAPASDGGVADFGMPTRRGGGQAFHKPGGIFPPAFYPDLDGWGALPWPKDPIAAAQRILAGDASSQINLDFREGLTRGLGYCRENVVQYASVINSRPIDYYEKPALNQVDRQGIYASRPKNSAVTFFERDEFMFRLFQIGISSAFGDA
jgi:hypothetical protein